MVTKKPRKREAFFVATQTTRSILIENAMYRTLLATCGSTEMKCINKASQRTKTLRIELKMPRRDCEASCLWCHQESNRGHKDFQSFALPTELWHQFLFASANLRVILILAKRRAVFLRFLGKRGWLAAELAAESSAVAGFPAV